MKILFTTFLLSLTFLCHSTENEWQDSWLLGLELLDNQEYAEAKNFFATAVTNMSKEELQQMPDVLIYLAQTNYMLNDFEQTLLLAKELLTLYNLSDLQRLICGNLVISSLWNEGREEEAIDAYSEYIIDSPLAPKCFFKEDKIIINNVPSCSVYKKPVKSLLTDEFCKSKEDFKEYGNIWVFNVTKNCKCKNLESNSYSKRVEDKKRTPEAIRGCCNTCSTLAVGGGLVCGKVPHWVCKSACFLFIETIRQICESCCYNGGYDEKCWTRFSFWKDDFHDKNPNCSHPNDWL